MCGIAGILQNNPNIPLQDCLTAMSKTIKHRGPDGKGMWISENLKIGLAHRRLAIIDLSKEAAQPMCDKDHNVFLTFNGEIYNHSLLRGQLIKKGHKFKTQNSDTEVLVHGYKEWGINGLVNRLDGMFAFAIWDVRKETLFLARDRIGIKPIYFCSHQGTFRFASEIKALLSDQSIPREMDLNALNHYLSFMISPAPLTMFKDIFKLPAAHIMEVSNQGSLKVSRYWDLNSPQNTQDARPSGRNSSENEGFYIEGLRSKFKDSVKKRLMADVPFGVFLSGGVDSSATVALMSNLMDRSVDTYTVGFKDYTHLNELEYAQQVSTKFKTNHHQILIDEKDMIGYLDDLIHYQDEPIADWVCIPLHFVSKLAKDNGTKVVQVGEGADEQFCGYDSWMTYLQFFKFFWNPYTKSMPCPLLRIFGQFSKYFSPSSRNRTSQFLESLERARTGHDLFFSGANAIWNIHKPSYLNSEALASRPQYDQLEESGFEVSGLSSINSGDIISSYTAKLNELFPAADQLTKMAFNEFRLRLPELLLMRLDKISMSNSIEGRVPFLDHELVEFSMTIPQNLKIKGGINKYLLKKTFSNILPKEIINRKKMGFSAPVSEWLKGEFGRTAEEIIIESSILKMGLLQKPHIIKQFTEHRKSIADHSLHLWTIFNLVSWHNYWIGNN